MNKRSKEILINLVNAEIDKEVKTCVQKIAKFENYDSAYLSELYDIWYQLKEE